jgi:hypothetical protein
MLVMFLSWEGMVALGFVSGLIYFKMTLKWSVGQPGDRRPNKKTAWHTLRIRADQHGNRGKVRRDSVRISCTAGARWRERMHQLAVLNCDKNLSSGSELSITQSSSIVFIRPATSGQQVPEPSNVIKAKARKSQQLLGQQQFKL